MDWRAKMRTKRRRWPQREKDSNCIRNHFRSIAASAAAAADAGCRCIVYGEQMKMIGVRLHIDRATVVRKPSPHNVQLKWRKKQRMHTIATSTQYEKCVSPFRFSSSFFLRSRVDAEPIYLRDDWRWISWTFDRAKRNVYFKSEWIKLAMPDVIIRRWLIRKAWPESRVQNVSIKENIEIGILEELQPFEHNKCLALIITTHFATTTTTFHFNIRKTCWTCIA